MNSTMIISNLVRKKSSACKIKNFLRKQSFLSAACFFAVIVAFYLAFPYIAPYFSNLSNYNYFIVSYSMVCILLSIAALVENKVIRKFNTRPFYKI